MVKVMRRRINIFFFASFDILVYVCIHACMCCVCVQLLYIAANVYFHGYLHVLKYHMIKYEMYDIRYLTLS